MARTSMLLLGALLVAVLTAANSQPADAEAKAAVLPADLAKIPSDGVLMLSFRVADLWDSELLKPAREKYRKEIDETTIKEFFRKRCGLSPEKVERMTLLSLSPTAALGKLLLFVRTINSYDLAKVAAAVQNVKEKKYKDKMLYIGEEDWTIYPLDDRSLVFGKQSEVTASIDRPQPKSEGSLAAALRLAAGKHSVVLGMNGKLLKDHFGSRFPGEVEPFLPLLKARSATFRMDLAADLRIAGAFAFASEKDAKAAISPAEAGLVLLRAGLGGTLAVLSKHKEDKGAADLFRLFKQGQDLLKATRIEQKGAMLHAAVEAKIDTTTAGLILRTAMQTRRSSHNPRRYNPANTAKRRHAR